MQQPWLEYYDIILLHGVPQLGRRPVRGIVGQSGTNGNLFATVGNDVRIRSIDEQRLDRRLRRRCPVLRFLIQI